MQNIAQQIEQRLQTLHPSLVEVRDQSAAHAGHAGAADHAGRTGAVDGTHLDLTVVSPAFSGKSRLACHRMVYELLDDLMKTRIHALSIDARAA